MRATDAVSIGILGPLQVDLDGRMLGPRDLGGRKPKQVLEILLVHHGSPVPKDRRIDAADIPSTYVPARNTVFLALALGWAEVLGAHDLVIGVNALDYSGYPDCRPEYVAAFEHLAALATARGVSGERFRIHAPLQHLTKADIIRRGIALGLDYGLTHSCYDPDSDGRPCGRCDSCLLRAAGFAEAGVIDPIVTR